MIRKEKELSEAHKRFCRLYAVCENGTAAYQHVFPASSTATAKKQASKLNAREDIKAYVEECRDLMSARRNIAVHELIEERLNNVRSGYALAEEMKSACYLKMRNARIYDDKNRVVGHKLTNPDITAIAKGIVAATTVSRQATEELVSITGLDVLEQELVSRIKAGEFRDFSIAALN